MPADPLPPKLLTAREAAARLGMSERKLFSLSAPRGPVGVLRDGRWVRYDPRDLDEFISRARCRPDPPQDPHPGA